MTNEEKVAKVIELIESGESERASCEKAGISRSTFRTTALRVTSGDQYARALTSLAHSQAEALEKTIDDMRAGTIDAQMARVEIDARKWFASKFLPKQYGDKLTTELTGADGGPVKTEAVVDWSKMSTEALREFQEVFAAGKDK